MLLGFYYYIHFINKETGLKRTYKATTISFNKILGHIHLVVPQKNILFFTYNYMLQLCKRKRKTAATLGK